MKPELPRWGILVVALPLLSVGCGSQPRGEKTHAVHGPVLAGQPAVVAGGDGGVDGDDEFVAVAEAYRQMSGAARGGILNDASPPRRPRPSATEPPVANLFRGMDITPVSGDAALDPPPPAPGTGASAPGDERTLAVGDPDPGMRALERSRLSHDLARQLAADAGDPRQATHALLSLAALELIEPGLLNTHFGDIARSGHAVPPRDRAIVIAWRDFFRDARSELIRSGDPLALASLADSLSLTLDDARAFVIPEAALCTKVEGFGVYTELPNDRGTYRLLAGRRHRLIVYAEVRHFAPRSTGGGQYEVVLSKDLSLHHYAEATDTLAWQRAGDEIRDISKNRRQDFFTAQIIELPETLSVGTYRLKITLRDRTNNGVAERVVPIEVVAHASALTRTAER